MFADRHIVLASASPRRLGDIAGRSGLVRASSGGGRRG